MLNNEISKDWKVERLLDITQGHDFIDIFQCYCKKNRGKEPSRDNIVSSLRCVWNIHYFKKTNLYKELRDYQNNNDIKIVS